MLHEHTSNSWRSTIFVLAFFCKVHDEYLSDIAWMWHVTKWCLLILISTFLANIWFNVKSENVTEKVSNFKQIIWCAMISCQRIKCSRARFSASESESNFRQKWSEGNLNLKKCIFLTFTKSSSEPVKS